MMIRRSPSVVSVPSSKLEGGNGRRSSLWCLESVVITVAAALFFTLASIQPTSPVSHSAEFITGHAIHDMPFFQQPQNLLVVEDSPTEITLEALGSDTEEELLDDEWVTTVEESYQDKVVSEGTIYGTISSWGSYNKQYYRFDNVELTDNDTLTFYLPPGVDPPPNHTVDVTFNNGSLTSLPTEIVARSGKLKTYHSLHIRYLPSETHQPSCRQTLERPAYLLQTQHSFNWWHVATEGILGAFQTLREQGLLPLARIDAEGNISEYVDDVGEDGGCAPIIEQGTGKVLRVQNCRPARGVVDPGKCNTTAELWCQPGVVAVNRSWGPVLVALKGTTVEPAWSHQFTALSEDVWSWEDAVGTCFKELYVGKSTVLNYYMFLRRTRKKTQLDNLWRAKVRRQASTTAAKLFIATAERVHRAMQLRKEPETPVWSGYEDPTLEKLRRGIGPEDIGALKALIPTQQEATEQGQLNAEEWKELKELLQQSSVRISKLARDAVVEEDELGLGPLSRGAVLETPRPVVTYILRGNFKRGILNAHQILRYILLRHNVTIKVTTFQEPLLETIELLSHTDVLLGMHGAGWTNALFLKRGAAGLQILPYGWRLKSGAIIRGRAFKSLIETNNCFYSEWVSQRIDYAFLRREDFPRSLAGIIGEYSLHPRPTAPLPTGKRPGNEWINQNTFVEVGQFAPVLDDLLESVMGISPVHPQTRHRRRHPKIHR